MDKDKYRELLEKMYEQVENGDWEVAHAKADDILCEFLEELGYKEIVALYESVGKWYA